MTTKTKSKKAAPKVAPEKIPGNRDGAVYPDPLLQKWNDATKKAAKGSRRAKAPARLDWRPLVEGDGYGISSYVENIFEFIANGIGHGMVEAVAGSGKTTTIVRALRIVAGMAERAGRPLKVLFAAYNKHIAVELAKKAPKGVEVSTCHSFGYGVLRKAFPYLVVEENRVQKMFASRISAEEDEYYTDRYGNRKKKWVPEEQFKAKRALSSTLKRMVDLCRDTLTDPHDLPALKELAERHDLETNGALEQYFPFIAEVYEECKDVTGIIDFTDMVWLPIALDLPVPKYDLIFIDETQDWSASMQELISRAIAPGGRLFAVGDTAQSIYGFRGADTEAMRRMRERFAMTQLDLSITYRCPASHVELAKRIVPKIEAAEGAKPGVVNDIVESRLFEHVQDGDLVLCRINKPLVSAAFQLISMGIKAQVKGRDIGSNLINLVDKQKAVTIEELNKKLDTYLLKEGERLMNANKLVQYDLLVDKIETLGVFISKSEDMADLRFKLQAMFTDDDIKGVTLSSIHKAKGLEAERVLILKPNLLPFPKAKRDWELEQESHIEYVALTRSKDTLIFVRDDVSQR